MSPQQRALDPHRKHNQMITASLDDVDYVDAINKLMTALDADEQRAVQSTDFDKIVDVTYQYARYVMFADDTTEDDDLATHENVRFYKITGLDCVECEFTEFATVTEAFAALTASMIHP